MSEWQALLLVARLSAFVALLQSAELLHLMSWFRTGGVWDWQNLIHDFDQWPRGIRALLTRYLRNSNFGWLIWFRIAVALFVMVQPEFFGIFLLFGSTVLIAMRFRGTFNGGSDSMTVLTLAAVWVGLFLPGSTSLVKLALAFITAQVTLSYVVAGFRKLASPSWRDGSAVGHLLCNTPFTITHLAITADQRPHSSAHAPGPFSRAASLLTLIFECGFFFALLNPATCAAFLLAGAVFHWLNYRIFGLNRFFWAWIVTYPAVWATVRALH